MDVAFIIQNTDVEFPAKFGLIRPLTFFPQLRRKKDIRKGIPFNVMICGAAGTGKSTFIRTLCDGRDPVVPMRTTRKSLSSVLEEKNSSNKLTRITSQEDLLNVPTPLYYKADSFYAAKVNEEPGINITETKYSKYGFFFSFTFFSVI